MFFVGHRQPPTISETREQDFTMIDALQGYPVCISQDVIWGDMDAFNHVNNTVYFRYFEDVRIATFEQLGVLDYMKQSNTGPILASSQCQFLLPLTYPDRIHIGCRIKDLAGKKFTTEYAVFSENFNAMAAQGQGLIVYYDYQANRSTEVPSLIVERIKAL